MSENITANTNVIPFRKAELLLIEKDGQPFVPMKPVVEGMGLAWASQTVKLNSNKARWGVSMIEIPSASGLQTYLCLPLKKLFGWLMTLHPSKVRAEIRDEIVAYQNECDDVLWSHWSEKIAKSSPVLALPAPAVLSPRQQRHVQQRVAVLAKQPGSSFASVYSSIKDRFAVGTYKDIPADSYSELCQFLGSEPLEGEWMGSQEPIAPANPGGIELNADETQALYLIMCHLGRLVEMHPIFHQVGRSLGSPVMIEAFTNLYDVQCHWSRLKRTKGDSLAKIHQQRMSRYERASA